MGVSASSSGTPLPDESVKGTSVFKFVDVCERERVRRSIQNVSNELLYIRKRGEISDSESQRERKRTISHKSSLCM